MTFDLKHGLQAIFVLCNVQLGFKKMNCTILPTWGHSPVHSSGSWLLLIGCCPDVPGKEELQCHCWVSNCMQMNGSHVVSWVSQQVTSRYVLLARQRCDSCVTIGLNRVYGGWGGRGHCTECGVSWHSETWRTNHGVTDLVRVQHPADVSSLEWETLCWASAVSCLEVISLEGPGEFRATCWLHVHMCTHSVIVTAVSRMEVGKSWGGRKPSNPTRFWMVSVKSFAQVFLFTRRGVFAACSAKVDPGHHSRTGPFFFFVPVWSNAVVTQAWQDIVLWPCDLEGSGSG